MKHNRKLLVLLLAVVLVVTVLALTACNLPNKIQQAIEKQVIDDSSNTQVGSDDQASTAQPDTGENTQKNIFKIVIGADGSNTAIDVDVDANTGKTLTEVLETLKTEGKLDITIAQSSWGSQITKVGTFTNGENGEYVYIYTNYAADYDTSEYVQTMDYNGTTLTSSGVGIDGMHFTKDTVIYIGKIVY